MPAKAIPAATPFANHSRAELLAMVGKMNWVHAIDLGDGVVTPGLWGRGNPVIEKALLTSTGVEKRCWMSVVGMECSFLAAESQAQLVPSSI